MKELKNIQGQQFYQATIGEFLNFCSENKCALIIDEENASALLKEEIDVTKSSVSQIIFISENINPLLKPFIGVNVFILSASSLEQALKFALHSEALNKKVACVVNDVSQLQSILSDFDS